MGRVARLADLLAPTLDRLGLLQALRVEMKVAVLLAAMEHIGIGFDGGAVAGTNLHLNITTNVAFISVGAPFTSRDRVLTPL